tara:strand:+ start:520 stop:768 length:249 start_codon:yes stop_codon:yes gene_type:complete
MRVLSRNGYNKSHKYVFLLFCEVVHRVLSKGSGASITGCEGYGKTDIMPKMQGAHATIFFADCKGFTIAEFHNMGKRRKQLR